MNKLTLIVDANWLLQSRASVMLDKFNINLSDIVKNHSSQELQELLARSLNIILRRFPMIDNIVIVADGGSWRKQLPIPNVLEGEGITYKGNRSQESSIDWSYIYKSLNGLIGNCKKLNITVTQYPNIEGDDWVWYWSRRLNSNNINCIVWTSDNDLKQLVQLDDNTNAFTAWYNDKNGLWLPEVLKRNDNDIDFFMEYEYISPTLESLKNKSKTINYINPDSIITSKVICGDSGDNIMSIFRYRYNGKTYKVSENDWNKIRGKINIRTIDDFIEHKEDIIDNIIHIKKYSRHKPSIEILKEMIDYNMKLVWLNESSIPDTIIQKMNQYEYLECDIDYIRNNFKVMVDNDSSIEDIFNSI